MNLNEVKKLNIPSSPGIYQFFNDRREIIYIGKAANLKSRILSYWQKSASHTPAKYKMLDEIVKIKWIETESEIEAFFLESNLIKKYQPYYNVLMRDDKRFCYIKISLEDEIPGVFITRKIDKSGRYFGPFTSALAVRETLRALRKIFLFCNMRRFQKKPCFYYQIGRCLGICGGLVNRNEYLKQVIKPLMAFLEGKKKKIIKNLEVRIKNYESGIRKQEAGGIKLSQIEYDKLQQELISLKYQLANMKRVLESANIIGVGEKYENDVIELAKLLNLVKIPQRIEGYDISNIFGREAVGSMVVFSGGEPDKSQYRKFKIRIGQGEANDVGMLKEVLERRFSRIPSPPTPLPFVPHRRGEINRESESKVSLSHDVKSGRGIKDEGGGDGWPSPGLIIIDGGKAQVNVAARVLKKYKLDIPVIAISKGLGLRSAIAPDKLFFPGEKKPLLLPLASPALHLIKRVRDEAHRFAIGYHRKLRGRKYV